MHVRGGIRWGLMPDESRSGGLLHLDELFLEQQLDDFLQDGQQSRVVHADAALQQWQQCLDEVQCPVFFFQAFHGLLENDFHAVCLFFGVEIEILALHEQCAVLALPAADTHTNC